MGGIEQFRMSEETECALFSIRKKYPFTKSALV
jgi:hypothetical protein